MTYQQIIDKTNDLSQKDFLMYLYQLKNIATQKYGINAFLSDFGKQKDDFMNISNDIFYKKEEKKKRKLGFLEGVKYYIADDFDAPLDDLKNYMY